MQMRPILQNERDTANYEPANIRFCPHVDIASASHVGCDDQGFGKIHWWFTCDDPNCIGAANRGIDHNMIDWNTLKDPDASGENARKIAERKLLIRFFWFW